MSFSVGYTINPVTVGYYSSIIKIVESVLLALNFFKLRVTVEVPMVSTRIFIVLLTLLLCSYTCSLGEVVVVSSIA